MAMGVFIAILSFSVQAQGRDQRNAGDSIS
jgi:hypothetical protein